MNEKHIAILGNRPEDHAYDEGTVSYEVKSSAKRKRYGRLVCCADCGSSKKTLFKIGDLYYCKHCKTNHTEN